MGAVSTGAHTAAPGCKAANSCSGLPSAKLPSPFHDDNKSFSIHGDGGAAAAAWRTSSLPPLHDRRCPTDGAYLYVCPTYGAYLYVCAIKIRVAVRDLRQLPAYVTLSRKGLILCRAYDPYLNLRPCN